MTNLLNEEKKLFLGRWKLLDCDASNKQKEKWQPFGEDPFGMLIYTPEYMSVVLSTKERTPFGGQDLTDVAPEVLELSMNEFETYCGSYSIDSDQKLIKHCTHAAKNPGLIGKELIRKYELKSDNHLVLKTVDPMLVNEQLWQFKLEWKKVE